MKTNTNSSLMWKIYKIHYIGDKYVKLRMMVYYKSNNSCCQWFNPMLKPKNFKILRSVFDSWENYESIG